MNLKTERKTNECKLEMMSRMPTAADGRGYGSPPVPVLNNATENSFPTNGCLKIEVASSVNYRLGTNRFGHRV